MKQRELKVPFYKAKTLKTINFLSRNPTFTPPTQLHLCEMCLTLDLQSMFEYLIVRIKRKQRMPREIKYKLINSHLSISIIFSKILATLIVWQLATFWQLLCVFQFLNSTQRQMSSKLMAGNEGVRESKFNNCVKTKTSQEPITVLLTSLSLHLPFTTFTSLMHSFIISILLP